MLKKMFSAAAAAIILAGASIIMAPAPAEASKSGCHEAAKAKYPDDHAARTAYKKECKAAWKAHKSAIKSA
jgi:hypothetical protein